MKKLRVGVWAEDNEDPNQANPKKGGGFSYYKTILKILTTYQFRNVEIVFLSFKSLSSLPEGLKKHTIQWVEFSPPTVPAYQKVANYFGRIINMEVYKFDYQEKISENAMRLKKELNSVVDIIYYPTPSCAIPNFPFIYTLWDIGHLSTYAFPELSMNGTFESRKAHHDNIPQKAIMVFCESEAGKKEAIRYLSLNGDRVHVLPMIATEVTLPTTAPKKPESLNSEIFFIHYPAQFWPHKNHYNLLIALTQVLQEYPHLKLIFTGADKGNKPYILNLIKEMNLCESVLDLGFVDLAELKWLYLNSQGLVMPTMLGPTNLPVIEAAELGCPVACSNIEGHIEQLGDYAYYFDPLSPEQISKCILSMIEDNLRGVNKKFQSKWDVDNLGEQMELSFSKLSGIRQCWGDHDLIF